MNINKYIANAAKEAEKSKFCPYKIGCVIVKGGKIIARGYNKYSGKIASICRRYNLELWSLHAEMDALIKAGEKSRGGVAFISGIKENGNRINCRPCKTCLLMLKKHHVKEVFYTTKSGDIMQEKI